MLKISDLGVRYHAKDRFTLEGINLAFENGFNVILGANGAGKSTLFKALLGNLKPSCGEIYFKKQNLCSLSARERAKIIAYVPQEWHSPFNHKVLDIVSMGFEPYFYLNSKLDVEQYRKIHALLDSLGIIHLANSSINALSGGQRALVLLARALIQDTPILLLDEPSAHLDMKNQKILLDIVKRLRDKIILINIHDPSIALDYANTITMMKNGKIAHFLPCVEIEPHSLQILLESLYEAKLFVDKTTQGYTIKVI